MSKKIKLALIGLFIIAFWIFFNFRLTEVPPGINGDEASIGYNAILLSQTLRDENKRLLPLFVLTMNGKDWKQPVTIYSTAIFFKIFGPSFTLLRQLSILFILTSAILLFLLFKEILNFKFALIGCLIFLTVPQIMIQSHLALENVAPLPFVIFSLLMFLKFEKNKNHKYLFLAGVSLGISFYSYNGMRLMTPILLLLMIIYIFYLNNFSFQKSVKTILPLIWGVLPFILLIPYALNKYPGALFANNQMKISSYQDFFLPYLSSFDPSFMFITGDSTPYHSTGKHGMYLLMTLPLFLIGCIKIIQKKNPFLLFILVSFFLMPVLFGTVGSIVHRGSRLMAQISFYVIIVTIGFSKLIEINKKKYRNLLISIVIILFLFNYLDFLRTYWFDYPGQVKQNFSPPLHIVFDHLKKESNRLNLTPFIEDGIYQEQAVVTKFFEQIYFKNGLAKGNLQIDFPNNSIMLLRVADAETLSKKGLKKINIDKTSYSLIMSPMIK